MESKTATDEQRGAEVLQLTQAARMLGMSTVTLYRAISAGEFPAVRIRNRLIVPAKALEAMADAALAKQAVIDAATWTAQR